MKILFLTQNLPYPPDSGGKIKTLKTLRLLAKKHTVFLASFVGQQRDLKHANYFRRLGIKSYFIVFPQAVMHFSQMKPFIARSLFSFLPFLAYRHRSQEMVRLVSNTISQQKPDAIHIDHLIMAQYLPKEKKQLWIYEEHNLDSETDWQIFCQEKWNKFKLFSFYEWLKMRRFEKKMMPRFDYWLAISNEDKRKMLELGARREKTFFYPVFSPAKKIWRRPKRQAKILFVGSLAWWPNRDGLFWFVDKVWPLLLAKFPALNFNIIGQDDSDKVANFLVGKTGIKFWGRVEKLEPHLSGANVFIIPLRTGSGIRIKALIAMTSGVPIVSTPKGIEGLRVVANTDLLVAETPEEFVSAIRKIIIFPKVGQNLSKNGLRTVQKNYSQRNAEKVLKQIYGPI